MKIDIDQLKMTHGGLLTILLIILACASNASHAQNEFDEFKAWQKQTVDDFSDYKSKQDKEFSNFLKMDWVGLKTAKAKPLYKKKKIIEPPKAPPEKIIAQTAKPVLVNIPEKKVISRKPSAIPKPPTKPIKGNTIQFDFYGVNLTVPYDKVIKKKMHSKIDKNTISKQWERLAKSNYEPMLKQLNQYQKTLDLNDWAYALLVNQAAKKLYPNKKNEQALYSWFVLIKSGYKARLTYKKRNIYLLLATKQKIFAAQSIKYKSIKYYVLNFDGGIQPKLEKVFTYNGDYPGSNQLFDMVLQKQIITGDDETKRNLEFTYANKNYKFNTVNNTHMVNFMKTYPQVHWDTYFNSNINSFARQQISNQLKPHLTGLSEQEAVNFLLRFVQTSLKYATDQTQFGYEKPLFPEESLFYPSSDCEDRSFLFAWLVQDLLGLDVIGLHYTGHMATAVRLNMKLNGDTVNFKGKTYLVADPTYINANVGRAMPKYKNSKVEVVEIKKI